MTPFLRALHFERGHLDAAERQVLAVPGEAVSCMPCGRSAPDALRRNGPPSRLTDRARARRSGVARPHVRSLRPSDRSRRSESRRPDPSRSRKSPESRQDSRSAPTGPQRSRRARGCTASQRRRGAGVPSARRRGVARDVRPRTRNRAQPRLEPRVRDVRRRARSGASARRAGRCLIAHATQALRSDQWRPLRPGAIWLRISPPGTRVVCTLT